MTSDTETDSHPITARDERLAAALVGRTINGFEVVSPLASGGMGTVFVGRQISIGRTVAIKVVREGMDPTASERFLREARIISTISHPNVVQLIDFGHLVEEGLMFYAMEHIEGVSLSKLSRRGRLHPNLVIEIGMQICSALSEAHAKGVVHRDLKASNMLISRSATGRVRLRVLDFGIAHSFADTAKLTQTGLLCGTPAYMAPEQVRGEESTSLVDLYALGINMHLMLAGQVPFHAANAIQVVVQHIQTEPPSLHGYADRNLVPRELVELTASLLAKDPARRPQSASDVRAQLVQIRKARGWDEVVAPDDDFGGLTRPTLEREEGSVPPDWVVDEPEQLTEPLKASMLPPLAGSDASRSGPLIVRSGGGWSAFNETPAASDAAQEPILLDPVTGEYMSVGDPDLAPAAQRPASSVPDRAPESRRVFSTGELVPVLPVNKPPPPTSVAEPKPSALSFADGVRFVAVAIIVFGICVGIAIALSNDAEEPAVTDEIDTVAMDAADKPDAQIEAVELDEPSPGSPKKAVPPKRKKRAKNKSAEIDVFDDVPGDSPQRTIVIEESP